MVRRQQWMIERAKTQVAGKNDAARQLCGVALLTTPKGSEMQTPAGRGFFQGVADSGTRLVVEIAGQLQEFDPATVKRVRGGTG